MLLLPASMPTRLEPRRDPEAGWCRKTLQAIPTLEGLVVIDVVEGTALASLPHMSAILARRPPSFPSLRAALEWAQHRGAPGPLR